MASKGPKSNAPLERTAVTLPPVVPEATSAVSIPDALAATPAKPKRVPVAPKPVPAPASAPFVAEIPAPVAAEAPAPAPVIAPEPAPAAPVAALIEEEKTMDTLNTAAEATQAQAKAIFTDTTDRAKSAMEKGTKLLADMNDFSKGNIEAMVESTKIAAKGAEDVARYTTDYAKTTVEKANATARQFAAVKSPTEFMRLQSEVAKDTVDALMAETAKFTENYLKLLGEIAQPISNRVAVAAEKMKLAA